MVSRSLLFYTVQVSQFANSRQKAAKLTVTIVIQQKACLTIYLSDWSRPALGCITACRNSTNFYLIP